MIVCVSPSSQHFDETQNTLRYANRAKNIQTKVTRNVYNVNRHVKDFLVKIDEQMALINELKQQQKDHEAVAFAKFRKQDEKREIVIREGIARIRNAYDHSEKERLEKANNMKRLRQIEKRILMITSWVAAFDHVCDNQEEGSTFRNLTAMRKTAQGILLELESSRHHYRQRLAKSNWERAVDSALQNGMRQLKEVDKAAEGPDAACLLREVELLKANAEREALLAIAEDEKGGDAALVQVQLQAHFETMASIQNILSMSEDDAIEAARIVLGKILNNCTNVTSHVVKPDGSLVPPEMFPPTRSGTPKRKKQAALLPSGTPLKTVVAASLGDTAPLLVSPARASPKRRRVGVAKRGITFTPKKKSPIKGLKRVVRWRDDTEDGTLAEFEKTPQRLAARQEISSAESVSALPPPVLSECAPETSRLSDMYDDSSPTPAKPVSSMVPKPRHNRFTAGFLAKKSDGSPLPPTITSF
jgi:kinesin family protein 18/19